MLSGGYGVSQADALGYGIILQAVEIATAVIMGMPALVGEGLSWRDVRLRALQTAPVELRAHPHEAARGGARRRRGRGVRAVSAARAAGPAGSGRAGGRVPRRA